MMEAPGPSPGRAPPLGRVVWAAVEGRAEEEDRARLRKVRGRQRRPYTALWATRAAQRRERRLDQALHAEGVEELPGQRVRPAHVSDRLRGAAREGGREHLGRLGPSDLLPLPAAPGALALHGLQEPLRVVEGLQVLVGARTEGGARLRVGPDLGDAIAVPVGDQGAASPTCAARGGQGVAVLVQGAPRRRVPRLLGRAEQPRPVLQGEAAVVTVPRAPAARNSLRLSPAISSLFSSSVVSCPSSVGGPTPEHRTA